MQDIYFVHINKCAGSSIETALNLKFQHKTAIELRDEVGDAQWQAGLSAAFVRNPWDRVVSHYHWRVLTDQTKLGTSPVPFAQWVQRAYGEQDPAYYDKPKMFMPQLHWIAESSGFGAKKILVDFVGRFEYIERDFAALCRRIGLAEAPALPHLKKSARQTYRDYFSPTTIGIVGDWFHEDIIQFSYQF